MVLEKCTTIGSTRQFRMGLNDAFEVVIGDYGGGNFAGNWAQSFKLSYIAPANSLVINFAGYVTAKRLTINAGAGQF